MTKDIILSGFTHRGSFALRTVTMCISFKWIPYSQRLECREHGAVEVGAGDHLHGCGCPLCSEPLGEKRVRLYLEKFGILYIRQHAIKYKNSIYRADFFIPSRNIIIEYNGEQHYKPVKWFGGAKKFHNQQQRDKNVRDYCMENNIKLLEISYLQYPIIEQLLDVVFGKK